MEDPVLEWLDRLDEHWCQAGNSPPLQSWLTQLENIDSSKRDEIVSELLRADLNWRLRCNTLVAREELAVDELLKLSVVSEMPDLRKSLVDDEFVYRCETSGTETIDGFAALVSNRLNLSYDELRSHFQQTIIQRRKFEVKLFYVSANSDRPALKYLLGRQLEIGRANESEPPSPAILTGERPRLIIASCREVSVSRQQVLLQREQWSTVRVKNISNKVPISIGGTKQIQPQRQAIVQVPFHLLIGQARVKVEPLP